MPRHRIFFAAILLATANFAQPAPSVDAHVVLQVSLLNEQREFRIGEIIPLRLSFSSNVKNYYQINTAQYDRSGRMNYEQFGITPQSGAVDPLANYAPGMMGGLTNFQYLKPEPWTIQLNLNEWIRFTTPGRYKIVVVSRRVEARDPSTPFGSSPVAARANELTLTIIPADSAWQKQVFGSAKAALAKPQPAKPQEMEQYTAERREAICKLRFLGTPDAIREMAKYMRADEPGGIEYVAMLGLISAPDREFARSVLTDELSEPDHPIDQNFLFAMRTLNSAGNGPGANWQEEQSRVVAQLVAVLSKKRGPALSESLTTALNAAWDSQALPKATTDVLVEQLVTVFDQLPARDQNFLLSYRWDKISGAQMLPIVKRYAQAYKDFPEMRESNAFESIQLSGSALKHWYEMDPEGARPAIIKEISRPRPRFDARVLGILPDETLPQIDFVLVEHLKQSKDYEGSANIASLIARYETSAALSGVVESLDAQLGKSACAIQNPLLAYVLRVNPTLARPRIEQAISARGDGFTACNRSLFQDVSEIRYDPVLEDIAVHSLNDADPQVAMTAATMLGQFGSAAAENALWQRYSNWGAKWAGQESELERTIADPADDRTWEVGLGQNLMQAIATGKSWLSDESTLRQLERISKASRIEQQLEQYLGIWKQQPLTISISHIGMPTTFDGRVAQYEFHTMKDLQEKLSQFPVGSKFVLAMPEGHSAGDGNDEAELRAFLNKHGMSIAAKKQAN